MLRLFRSTHYKACCTYRISCDPRSLRISTHSKKTATAMQVPVCRGHPRIAMSGNGTVRADANGGLYEKRGG